MSYTLRNMNRARTPEEYLEEIKKADAAKLTIYVGFAAGVSKTYKMLADNLQFAKELGSEVVKLKGKNVVAELSRFAREQDVTYVIIGHLNRSWWEEMIRGNLVDRFIKEVGATSTSRSSPENPRKRRELSSILTRHLSSCRI